MTTPEEVAHELVSALGHLAGVTSLEVPAEPEEDMRSGGYFFDVVDTKDGTEFTVVVVRTGT